MRFFALLILFCLLSTAVLSADAQATEAGELSASDFIYQVRHPAARESWSAMDGEVQHLRRGAEMITAPLYLGMLFSPERTLAQIIIDGKQGYTVGQTYGAGNGETSVIPMSKKPYAEPLLPKFGLRPQDLTMTFLYWNLVREMPSESVKGSDCRVFELKSPDCKELVKVYISRKYFFPLKAEWFDSDARAESAPVRTLEVASFKKQDDFWLVNKLTLYGPGWRTKVNFDKTSVGYPENGIPTTIFRQLPEEK